MQIEQAAQTTAPRIQALGRDREIHPRSPVAGTEPLARFTLAPEVVEYSSVPVLMDSAMLYFVTGNDTAQYAERCQRDYVLEHALQGARTLAFTAGAANAAEFERSAGEAIERFAALNGRYYGLPGVRSGFDGQFVMWCESRTPSERELVRAAESTIDVARMRGASDQQMFQDLAATRFNQLTDMQRRHIEAVIARLDVPEEARALVLSPERRAENASLCATIFRFNDKSSYVGLIQGDASQPRHVGTVLLTPVDLRDIGRARDPWALLRDVTGWNDATEMFLKSGVDAGGEGCRRLSPARCRETLESLVRELESKDRPLDTTPLLLQRAVVPAAESALPARIGVSLEVGAAGTSRAEACAQIYSDADRCNYLGSHWSAALSREVTRSIGQDSLQHLAETFRNAGYRGPIGFDAMLDADDRYTMIYDCNPRLTAAGHVRTVRDVLESKGVVVNELMSFGHHGQWRFDSHEDACAALSDMGLLFSSSTGKGLLLMPHPKAPDAFDLYAVNMSKTEAAPAISNAARLAEASPCTAGSVFF